MKQLWLKSLSVKISLAVIVVEAVALAMLGLYYINRFSHEIDNRMDAQIRLPGILMNRQLLRYESVSNKEVMTEIVGEDFEDGVVIGTDQKVYYALHPDDIRKTRADIAWIQDASSASELKTTSVFRQIVERDTFLICATPIVAYEGGDPVFVAFIKVNTKQSEAQKERIRNIFVFGSFLCIFATSAAIIIFIRRAVVFPINTLQTNVEHVAQGNLEQAIDTRRGDEIGALASSFAMMRDVIRDNIDDLRHAEERYRKIFENALEGIFQIAPDTGNVLRTNTAMAKILGFNSVEELEERVTSLRSYLFSASAEWNSFIEHLRTHDHIFGLEIEGKRHDSSPFWGALSARTVCDADGVTQYYEGFLADITETKARAKTLKEQEHAAQERELAEARRQFIAAVSKKTSDLAKISHANISRMDDSMGYMEQASRTIAEKLQEIHDKAQNITSMITTITRVADQTNLLSLNAAIEAEKAGEYGRGFAVVAQEIRRLADQTAVATLDIEEMVQVMQAAVSAGVGEIEHFVQQVAQSSENIGRVSQQLTGIIEQVQQLMNEDRQDAPILA